MIDELDIEANEQPDEIPSLEMATRTRDEIDKTHSWVHKCFPPRPTTCFICGASRSDPNLQPCHFA